MTLSKGPLLTLALCIGLPLLAAAGVMHYVASSGVIAIDVQERGPGGDDISLRIPVWLVGPAIDILPSAAWAFGQEGPGNNRWYPMADALFREIERCPDAVLVSVDSPAERVRIEKKRGMIIVEVDDSGDHVRVAVPARFARKMARFASRVCDRDGDRDRARVRVRVNSGDTDL